MAGLLLVADIGGTNTRVGLADDSGLIDGSTRRYRNAETDSFEAALDAYVTEMAPGPLDGVCAGAAGPVTDGIGRMTNLSWEIDPKPMRDVTGAAVADVINDLQAQGYALDDLTADTTRPVVQVAAPKVGPRLVVGLGTGFNIVPVHRYGQDLVVPSCEGGHATLPYRKDQAELCDWLSANRGYASIEVALAGQGIENIYEFHSGEKRAASDIMMALDAGDPKAQATLKDYVALLGCVVGDYALSHLPFGGIYLTGGVARAVTPHLAQYGFAEIKAQKGRFSELAGSINVTLIEDDFAALKGCARHLRQLHASQS
ncbi:glucokinase [Cognatishimia sp. WU-CL00825]|uniref:glucokinase n=1 Tax=Cognatishimia sp. WU-CL00825 TaxID=3127658 RepID=UPI00310BD337